MWTAEHEERWQETTFRTRAQRAALEVDTQGDRQKVGSFAIVRIGGMSVGLSTTNVRAIVATPPIALLPGLPSCMPGIAQIRGEPLSVVDLRQLYALAPGSERPPLVAVLQAAPGRLGALVDQLEGFRTIFADEVSESRQLAADLPILGTTRDLVHILDVDSLADDSRIMVSPATSDTADLIATAKPSPGPARGPKRGEL